MSITLPQDTRTQAVTSIERWFQHERGEKVGNITAAALLNFMLEEIAPSVYNQAVADMQERLAARVQELDIEAHEPEFGYWRKADKTPKGRAGG